MNNPIEILPNIYGVKVPNDANELEFICLESKYLRLKTNSEYQNIKLPFGTLENIKILGTLTKDEISFDASEIMPNTCNPRYKGYCEDFCQGKCYENIEGQFRSELPKEIYFENPFEKPNCDCNTEYDREGCPDKCYQWINANNGITEKLLILQKL